LGVTLDYYEDAMPRGPAGCIRDAGWNCAAETFVVVHGTVLPQINLGGLLQAHQRSGCALTMVAVEQDPGADGSRVMEPAGIYVVSRPALEWVPARGYQDIKEMWVPRLYRQGQVCVPYIVEADAAIGVMGASGYLRAVGAVLERMSAEAEWANEYRRMDSAWVHETARVAPSVHIAGPVLIGPGAWVNRSAGIVGPAQTHGSGRRPS
jgi:NDP-sugar pyrophosphorylase family protein